jgi:nucleotide-binding universal stress UspA family protein
VKHVLCAIDLSDLSDAALDRAIAFAARDGAQLTLVYAEPDYHAAPGISEVEAAAMIEWTTSLKEIRASEKEQLEDRCEAARAAGVACTAILRQGRPDDVLPEVAAEIGADLVVIATHGRTGIRRFLLGSVAEHVVRRSPVSVLVTRGATREDAAFRRVLVGTDFSPASEKALRQAVALSVPGAEIEVAHVWHYPPGTWGLDALADRTEALDALRTALTAGATERGQKIMEEWKGCGRRLRFELLHGPAASVLTARAEAVGSDLIAVGTHGYRGFRRFLLGSIAEATVRHAPCSVLVAHAEHPQK